MEDMFKKWRKSLTFFIQFILFILLVGNSEAQIRVMSLGDGVVVGIGSSGSGVGGFRDDLYLRLNSDAMPFDFVGSQDDGFSVDPDHEGYANATVAQINQNLYDYLNQAQPHIVIVYVGTEEIVTGDVNTMVNGLTETINIIDNFSHETEIVMSTLVPNLDSANPLVNLRVNDLNTQIQSLVITQKALGKNIYLADQNSAFEQNPSFMSADGVHPNDVGYQIMANTYYQEITTSSHYWNAESYTDNFNGKVSLGLKWTAHPAFQIQNNELANTSTQYVWDNMLAAVNSVVNPNTIDFRFSLNADIDGIAETGTAILLDSAATHSDGYLVIINNNSLRLFTLVGGNIGQNVQNINIGSTFPQPNDIFRVTVDKDDQGYYFSAYINGNLIGSLTDNNAPSPTRSHFGGVMMRGNLSNNIDDFYVTNVKDETPPAAVSDLQILRTGPTSVELQWTATGDDSATGQAIKYNLRYATFPISESNFYQTEYVALLQTPSPAQTVEDVFVSGLKPNTQYYFALKVIDDNKNVSAISNVPNTTLGNSVYFLDDFERSDLGAQWQAGSGAGISNGALTTSNSSNDWSSSAVLGTPQNPIEVGFQWSSSIASGQIKNAGILIKLNAESNGYFVKWDPLNKQFQLWSYISGSPTEMLASFSEPSLTVVPGDYIKIYQFAETAGMNFAVFVNNIYAGKLIDVKNIFSNNDPHFCGVLLHGNSTVAVENFFLYAPVVPPAQLLYSSGNSQSDTVGQTVAEPLTVQVLDGDGNPVSYGNVHFELQSGDASFFPPTFPDGTVYLEAENGSPISPMAIGSDVNASGGAYLATPAGSADGGSILLKFYVNSPGNYLLWGRCIAPSISENSFSLQIDNQPEFIWPVFHGGISTEWEWEKITALGSGTEESPEFDPYFIYLDEGIHTILVKRLEAGTKLDKLIVTKNTLFNPIGKEEVTGFPSDFSGFSKTYVNLGPQSGPISITARMDELPGQDVNFQLESVRDAVYQLVYVSGNQQTGKAGETLSQPLMVKAADQYGNPVPGYSVNFAVTLGNGQIVESQPVQTGADGTAAVTFILATDIQDNRVEARANGLVGSPVEFTATASSGFPTAILDVSGNDQTGSAGTALANPLVVRVVDGENSPISGYEVTFENRSTTTGGVLSATKVNTNANGEASVTFTFGTATGQYQVAAIANGLQNSPVLFNLTAVAGPAYKIVKVSGDSALGVSSYPLSEPFVVRVFDRFDNAVSAEGILFKVTAGGGHFQDAGAQVTVPTDTSGFARATLILGAETGNYNNKAQAEKSGLQGSPVQFVATALPPTASYLKLYDGDNQIGVINNTLPAPLRVRVSNAVDEPAKNHPVTFRVVSGGGLFTGSMDIEQTVATNAQGIAEVTFKCGSVPGPGKNVIHATSQVGSTSLIGSPVVFHESGRYPGVKISEVRGNNQQGLIGELLPVPLEVKILDDNNNPVAGQRVEFVMKSGNGKMDGGTDTLLVKETGATGKASVQFTLGSASGLNSYVIHVRANDGFQDLQGSPVVFQESAALTTGENLLRISDAFLTGTVGKALSEPVKVKVTDKNDQPVAEQNVTFRILAGKGHLGPQTGDTLKVVRTNSSGIARVEWFLGTSAGQNNNRLSAAANNGVADLHGSAQVFTATSNPDVTDPNISTVSATSPVKADGQEQSIITVVLRDKFKNPIVGKGVILTASGEFAFLHQPASVTNDSGKTTGYMTSIRAGKKKIYARNSSDNVVLANPAEVEFTPSEASRISVFAGNDQIRNIGTSLANPLVVLVTDDFDNPIPGYSITFRVQTPNGRVVDPQPVLTDSLGMARADYILSDTPGTNLIEADAGNLTGSPALFTATGEENPPHRLVYRAGNNQTGVAGKQLAEPVSVRVVDASDNPVKNVAVTFAFSFGDGQIVNGQPVRTNAYGVASSRVVLGRKVGTDLVSATVSGLVGSPFTFVANVLPDEAKRLEIVAGDDQNSGLQSQSQSLIVSVQDIYGNPVPGAGVRFEIVSGAASMATAQPVLSNNLGQAGARILSTATAGEVQVRASLESNPSAFVLFTVHIVPAEPKHLTLVGRDQLMATVGHVSALPLQALVTDDFDNPVPGVKVNFVISSGDAAVYGAAEKLTGADGIAKCHILAGSSTGQIEVFATSSSDPTALLTYHLTAVNNEVPVLEPISDQQVQEAGILQVQITGSDADGDSLAVNVENEPKGSAVTKLDDAKWQFHWQPDYDQSGQYSVIFSVYDQKGGAAWDTVSIKVENVNRKPVLTYFYPPRDTSLVPGQQLSFEVQATDPDGQPVTINWYKNNVSVSDLSVFIYKSPADFTGQDKITVFVSDGEDSTKYEWTITVKTAVEMGELTANADEKNNTIILHWNTRAESDNLGFEIWRSAGRKGKYLPINPEIIRPNGQGQYSFTDDSVQAGIPYYYLVIDQNIYGAKTQHGPVQAMISLPESFRLEQNFPNPFVAGMSLPNTEIRFQLPGKGKVQVRIFNLLGQQVRVLADRQFVPGRHSLHWDGRDSAGKLVTSGIYYYEMRAGKFKAFKRMLILK